MNLIEQLNLINIKISHLENKKHPLTVGDIWDLSDLRDSRDELKQMINEEEQEYKTIE